MATATESSVSDKRASLPNDIARRMLCKSLFTPRSSLWFVDDQVTQQQLDIPAIFLEMKELGSILRQIIDLANGERHDDDGVLAPTEHATNRTNRLLIHASTVVWQHCSSTGQKFIFPRGFVSTDAEGGLRIEWSKPEASLRLVIAASESGKSYLYHEFGEKYGSERNITDDLLARWLVRFLSAG